MKTLLLPLALAALLCLAGCAATAPGPGLSDAQRAACAAEGGCGYVSAKALSNLLAHAYMQGVAKGRELARESGL